MKTTPTLLDLMKIHGKTVTDLAKELDVSASQIYKWNREGISINCKHYLHLKQLIPQVIPKEITVTLAGKEDGRIRAGRKRKELNPTTIPKNNNDPEKEFISTLFPKITIRNKTT